MKKKYCEYCGGELKQVCKHAKSIGGIDYSLYDTYEKAEKNADLVYSYPNGDYRWKKDGVYHLMRDGKEIASGDWVWSYPNGDYGYKKDGVGKERVEFSPVNNTKKCI